MASLGHNELTHWPLDIIATILADNNFKCIFLNEIDKILIWISLKFVPKSPIDNKPVLVQAMAWCWIGHKPLSEPVLTRFIDAYVRHQGEMSKLIVPWEGDEVVILKMYSQNKSFKCTLLVKLVSDKCHRISNDCRKFSNIRRTKSPNLNVSRLVVQLSLPKPMKPDV